MRNNPKKLALFKLEKYLKTQKIFKNKKKILKNKNEMKKIEKKKKIKINYTSLKQLYTTGAIQPRYTNNLKVREGI